MSDFKLIRTNSMDPQFQKLVEKLDVYLAVQDGDEHAFYDQYNKIAQIKYAIVGYSGSRAVCCGAIKSFNSKAMEVKRMYVLPEFRGKGYATLLLRGLEEWSLELNYSKCLLETGTRQPEAIALYKKNGYVQIANYGQYTGVTNSLCFEKILGKKT